MTLVESKKMRQIQQAAKAKIQAERRRLESLKPPDLETAQNPLIRELIQSVILSPLVNTNDFNVLKTKETVINFLKIINRRKIEIAMLRSLAFRGIPNDIKGLRPLVWKILLGYLPRETAKWEEVMAE